MHELRNEKVSCPYCGETLEVVIDCSESQQNYIEDCQVCCRPIVFDVVVGYDGEPCVSVTHEND